jgi:6-phosphogluconolactonase
VRVYADLEDLARAARAEIVRRGTDLIQERGRFTLVLSGGRTPRRLYQLLEPEDLEWERVQLFFGDERCVPPDAEGSNYGMARGALLNRIPVSPEQVHRIPGELAPEEAARRAEEDLRASVPGDPWPVLDLVVLGMGPDGHTASLFPGSPELEESTRLMVPVHRPEMPQPWRVSMTLPVINAARRVLVLVGGSHKAPMVRRALDGDPAVPAGRVRPAGELTWLISADAATELEDSRS